MDLSPELDVTVNWTKVEDARRRGKLGQMRHGDQELCDAAYAEDPKRYSEMARRVSKEVDDEIRTRGF